MRKYFRFHIILLSALTLLAYQSCKRNDAIDNNIVIETPYSLFFSDTGGALYATNDGKDVRPLLFPSDGYPSRALCTAGNNILWVKHNMYYSPVFGGNFNPNFFWVNDSAVNQTLVLNAADHDGRVYLAATDSFTWPDFSTNNTYIRGMGVYISDQNGSPGSFVVDSNYDPVLNSPAPTISTGIHVTTFTEVQNPPATIYAYDPYLNRLFYKVGKTGMWTERKQLVALPQPNAFTLAHFNNILVAVDYKYGNGAYYSPDAGGSWIKFTGLPQGRNLFCASSPFDMVLLVGTDSMGVYKLNIDNTSFSSANVGLTNHTTVKSIAAKENVYKNDGITQQYIYLATTTGLYRSEDLGQSWILYRPGNYVSAY